MKLLLSSILLSTSVLSSADESEKKRPPASIQDIVAIKIPKIEAKDAELHELISFVAYKIVELDPKKPLDSMVATSVSCRRDFRFGVCSMEFGAHATCPTPGLFFLD